ncbi:MAG TPA: glutathione S-transferase family protein [Polyangiales bacterium]|nr:glutathione S-transferase family protein [Polyangiales bacterium]
MKLYYHPASTTSRTIMLFASEASIPLEYEMVDIMSGEHLKPTYRAINPNALVPMLEDGSFRLTESSAILKYLADTVDSPAYPKPLKERARVNELMDWINSNLYKDLGYNLAYPQLLPHHKRDNDTVQTGSLAWGRDKTNAWLSIMDKDFIGPNKQFLCGDKPTIADYFGAPILSLLDLVQCDYARYPNLKRWLSTVKGLPSWPKVNEAFHGWTAAVKDQPFVSL